MFKFIKNQFQEHPYRTAIISFLLFLLIASTISVALVTTAALTGGLGPLGFLITGATAIAGMAHLSSNAAIMATLGGMLSLGSLGIGLIGGGMSLIISNIFKPKNPISREKSPTYQKGKSIQMDQYFYQDGLRYKIKSDVNLNLSDTEENLGENKVSVKKLKRNLIRFFSEEQKKANLNESDVCIVKRNTAESLKNDIVVTKNEEINALINFKSS